MADKKLFCSWCQRSKDDVKYLLAGPGVAVCEECVGELSAILAERHNDGVMPKLNGYRNCDGPKLKI